MDKAFLINTQRLIFGVRIQYMLKVRIRSLKKYKVGTTMIYLITCIEKSNGSKVCITKASQ